MYVICHTNNNDTKAALKEMNKKGYMYPILQVGQKLYKRLDKARMDILDIIDKKDKKYTVNIKTGMIHKKGCKKQGKKTVEAYLIRPNKTGLPLCKLCMKQ